MPLRALLRILLLVALIPLVLRSRDSDRSAGLLGSGRNGNMEGDEDEWEGEEEFEDEDDLLLDINSAPRAALMALPGIDGEHADLILEQRPFRSKHDLLRLGIVADDVYRALRDHIVARQSVSQERA